MGKKSTSNLNDSAAKVAIRRKSISGGRESLYLDIYNKRQRSYEFLDLYILPELSYKGAANDEQVRKIEDINAQIRERNSDAWLEAEAIRAAREAAIIQGGAIVTSTRRKRGGVPLLEWLETYKDYKAETGQSTELAIQVGNLINHIKLYRWNGITLNDVDESFCAGFIEYLGKAQSLRHKSGQLLSPNTRHLYYSLFSMAINEAVSRKLMDSNPMERISRRQKAAVRKRKSGRTFLDVDEVKSLIDTPCHDEDVKRAFLFAVATGLRCGDIRRLKWSDIRNGVMRITMQKTGAPLRLKLNDTAKRWLPEKRGDGDSIFCLPSRALISKVVRQWRKDAGIDKPMSFHTSRHTFATLSLKSGADLYEVSKNLGHASISVTQVYADLVDESRDRAMDMLDSLNLV